MIVIPCSVGIWPGLPTESHPILRLPQGKTPTPAVRRRNTCCGYGFCWLPLQLHCCSAKVCDFGMNYNSRTRRFCAVYRALPARKGSRVEWFVPDRPRRRSRELELEIQAPCFSTELQLFAPRTLRKRIIALETAWSKAKPETALPFHL